MLLDKHINKVLWITNTIFISITTQTHQLSKRTETHSLVGVADAAAVVKGAGLFLVHPDKFGLGGLQVGEEHVVFRGDE